MMKRKLSLIMVVVMVGVILSGCAGEMSLEGYTKSFLKVSEEYDATRADFVDELNTKLNAISISGVAAVASGNTQELSKKLIKIHEKFEKITPYPDVEDAHNQLSAFYKDYADNAVMFADALKNGDFPLARDLAYELESIDFDMVWAEIDMYDQLGIEVDF